MHRLTPECARSAIFIWLVVSLFSTIRETAAEGKTSIPRVPPQSSRRLQPEHRGNPPSPPRTGTVQGLADPCDDDVLDLLWRKSDHYFHEGDYNNAIRLHRLLVDFRPAFTDAYGVAAWLLESSGRDREALSFLKRGLAANGGVYDIYFELGHFYFRRKDYKTAREYFEQGVKFEHPSFLDRMLAHACEKQGDLQASRAVWKKILSENPEDAVAARNLQRVEARIATGK